MLRNIARVSRWMVRKEINSFYSFHFCSNAVYLRSVQFSRSITSTPKKFFATDPLEPSTGEQIDPIVYDQICSETLESLSEYFDELTEQAPNLKGADITYSDGVLTVHLGPAYGTYVINRQSPNKQIWLSSPTSGPKRYDLVLKDGGFWIYKHDGVTLHKLLQEEISKIAESSVDFKKCSHSVV